MYKKITLIFSCSMIIGHIAMAENPDFCRIAKDSMKVQFARGELGCYVTGKGPSGVVNQIKIFNTHYEKISTKFAAKDSISKDKLDELKKNGVKPGKSDSGNQSLKIGPLKQNPSPFDTSTEFKLCYNKAFQSKLDSAFKCDFFRKSDSILKSYDKQGKGYKNVEFAGGPVSMQKFMDKNITLPKDAKPTNDTDKVMRVYYSFYIDEKGIISEPKLIKSNCKACEEPVLAAIKILPPFIPATEAGKAKKVKYILPYTKTYTKPKN